MSEIQPFPLAVGILPDYTGRLWLLHRPDHMQWQLPGGKLWEGETAIQALVRNLGTKLGVSPSDVRHVATPPPMSQGSALYECELYEIMRYSFEPQLMDTATYDKARLFNPSGRMVGKLSLSPVTRHVLEALDRGNCGEADGILLEGINPVQ